MSIVGRPAAEFMRRRGRRECAYCEVHAIKATKCHGPYGGDEAGKTQDSQDATTRNVRRRFEKK